MPQEIVFLVCLAMFFIGAAILGGIYGVAAAMLGVGGTGILVAPAFIEYFKHRDRGRY